MSRLLKKSQAEVVSLLKMILSVRSDYELSRVDHSHEAMRERPYNIFFYRSTSDR